MRPKSVVRRRVRQVRRSGAGVETRLRSDSLAAEEPLEVRVAAGGAVTPVSVTMRTPGYDFELAAGFLYGEGVVDRRGDVLSIRYCKGGAQHYNTVTVELRPGARFDPERLRRNVYTTSSCGVCGKASIERVQALPKAPPAEGMAGAGARVPAEVILGLPEALRAAQPVFERTGGLHAAALFSLNGELLRLREDVGRHNALDKVTGSLLLADGLPAGGVLLVSGRLSFELVQKAVRAGAPVLAGVSAPSSLAVELAAEVGITLVGFLRGGRFNVYAGEERIVLERGLAGAGLPTQ